MSIENNLASIAKSLETIAAHISADKQDSRRTEVVTGGQIPVPAPAPAAAVPMPVPAPAPAAAVPMPMPAPAAPAAPVGAAPFTDGKSLMEYVMGKYKKLGPIKGGLIQNALSELGLHNINDLKAEHYAAFYAKVEAIQ